MVHSYCNCSCKLESRRQICLQDLGWGVMEWGGKEWIMGFFSSSGRERSPLPLRLLVLAGLQWYCTPLQCPEKPLLSEDVHGYKRIQAENWNPKLHSKSELPALGKWELSLDQSILENINLDVQMSRVRYLVSAEKCSFTLSPARYLQSI